MDDHPIIIQSADGVLLRPIEGNLCGLAGTVLMADTFHHGTGEVRGDL
jgi:hypothetical protein